MVVGNHQAMLRIGLWLLGLVGKKGKRLVVAVLSPLYHAWMVFLKFQGLLWMNCQFTSE